MSQDEIAEYMNAGVNEGNDVADNEGNVVADNSGRTVKKSEQRFYPYNDWSCWWTYREGN